MQDKLKIDSHHAAELRASQHKHRQSLPHDMRRGGFTIIELMVVIGIAALVAAIALSGLVKLGENNRRMSCQSNLAQVYQSARLYMQDEQYFPYFDPNRQITNAGTPVEPSIGLWALYAFPRPTDPASPNPEEPYARYLRNPRVLHCPQDSAKDNGELIVKGTTAEYPGYNGVPVLNKNYLSYQKQTPVTDEDPATGEWSYQTVRTTDQGNADWKRQLTHFSGNTTADRVYRVPSDDTVITWCRFHRKTGGRNFDNVLFYDGSVQLVPHQQNTDLSAQSGTCGAGCVITWHRKPRPPV
jgi:prepilin-type N-terminal cleavage/methylation domain-containing protein